MKMAEAIPGRITLLMFLSAAVLLCGCSSAPKRPAEIFTQRNMAETSLEQANRETDRGNYEFALTVLNDARKTALSVDSPDLLIRTDLAMGNALFYLGREEEGRECWASALTEAELSGEAELGGLARIYMARGRLVSAASQGSSAADRALAEEVLASVKQDMELVKSNKLYAAIAWNVTGLAEKELGRYGDAEKSVKNALAVHEKDNYLELAAYDWYLIASIRSVAGDLAGAEAALGEALSFDRRSENSYGLGMDWLALGDVYKKMNRSSESASAYRRSADIFRAIFLEKEAEIAEERLKGL